MQKTKYITYVKGGLKSGIIFDELIDHVNMASMLTIPVCDVLGAGFVDLTPDPEAGFGVHVNAFGESVTLNIKSRRIEDRDILRRVLGLTY